MVIFVCMCFGVMMNKFLFDDHIQIYGTKSAMTTRHSLIQKKKKKSNPVGDLFYDLQLRNTIIETLSLFGIFYQCWNLFKELSFSRIMNLSTKHISLFN